MGDLKYYIDDEFNAKDRSSWTKLLERFLSVGDAVEFNIFSNDLVVNEILNIYSADLIEIGRRKNKIYPSGKFVRFNISQSIRNFIFSRNYNSWKNFCLQDISILKDGREILATVTHENYIYITGTSDQINDINKLGFKFERSFVFVTK